MSMVEVTFALIEREPFRYSVLGKTEVWMPEKETGWAAPAGYWPHLKFLCPHCGEAWADMLYHYTPRSRPLPDVSPRWAFISRPCRKHGSGVIGDDIPLHHLPPAVMKYLAVCITENYQEHC